MSTGFRQPDVNDLDFESARDLAGDAWKRSHPSHALIESFGRFGFKVTLRDGESVHYCALGVEDDEYIGRCDCKGWKYHNGPCAHLCTLRKADFLNLIEVAETDSDPRDEHEMCQSTGETFEGEHHQERDRDSNRQRTYAHERDPPPA